MLRQFPTASLASLESAPPLRQLLCAFFLSAAVSLAQGLPSEPRGGVQGNVRAAGAAVPRTLQSVSTPSLTGLASGCINLCDSGYTLLDVTGAGFQAGAVFEWNGAPLSTVFNKPTDLSATLPSSLVPASALGSWVTIMVVNPDGGASNILTFQEALPYPSIAVSALPAGTAGTPYLQTLIGLAGFQHYANWVLASGALPPGLTLDANAGTISGVPTAAASGSYTFGVIMEDFGCCMTPYPASFTVTINPPPVLTITTPSPLKPGVVGIPYSQVWSAASGTVPYVNWAVTAGDLPPGTMLTGLRSDPYPAGVIFTMSLAGTPSAAGNFNFTLQVTDSAGANAAKQFSLTINPAGTVSIDPGGIVNSASYEGGGVSPGEIVTIFGSGLGPLAGAGLEVVDGLVVTNLAGVQVTIGGSPAPLVYVQATQINAIVPYAAGYSGSSAQVQVTYQGRNSAPVTVPVVQAAPGIYTLNYSGTGAGAILNQDGTVNAPSNPALVGSVVTVYATGEGQTTSGVDGKIDGSPAPQPALCVVGALSVPCVAATIGGVNAVVVSAGGVTGAPAGILEVALRVPQSAGAAAAPVTLSIGGSGIGGFRGATSQAGVTLSVAQASVN